MNLVSTFIGILFLLGGMWRLVTFSLNWRASNVQGRWEMVTGTITRAELQRISPRDEPDSIAMYGVNIIYLYTLGDKNYRGEVTDDDLGVISKQRGDQLTADFAKGNKIDVFYNPYQPNISTLFPAADSRLYRQLALGIGAVVVGGGLIIVSLF